MWNSPWWHIMWQRGSTVDPVNLWSRIGGRGGGTVSAHHLHIKLFLLLSFKTILTQVAGGSRGFSLAPRIYALHKLEFLASAFRQMTELGILLPKHILLLLESLCSRFKIVDDNLFLKIESFVQQSRTQQFIAPLPLGNIDHRFRCCSCIGCRWRHGLCCVLTVLLLFQYLGFYVGSSTRLCRGTEIPAESSAQRSPKSSHRPDKVPQLASVLPLLLPSDVALFVRALSV